MLHVCVRACVCAAASLLRELREILDCAEEVEQLFADSEQQLAQDGSVLLLRSGSQRSIVDTWKEKISFEHILRKHFEKKR